MFPYLTYGLIAWGQAAQTHLNKLLLLQKRTMCFITFVKPRTQAVPLFMSSKIFPVNMLYFGTFVHFLCMTSLIIVLLKIFLDYLEGQVD